MHTLPVLPWSHLWSSPFCTLLTPLMSAMSPFVVDLHVCSQRNNPVFSKGTREHILFLFAFLILANSGRLWFWLKGIANNFYLWISEWIINSKFKLKNKVNQLNSYISLKVTYKILIPNLMVLGDGALRKWLGSESRVLMMELLSLIKEITGSSLAAFHHVRVQDRLLWNRKQTLPTPPIWSWTSCLPEVSVINVFGLYARYSLIFCYNNPKIKKTFLTSPEHSFYLAKQIFKYVCNECPHFTANFLFHMHII